MAGVAVFLKFPVPYILAQMQRKGVSISVSSLTIQRFVNPLLSQVDFDSGFLNGNFHEFGKKIWWTVESLWIISTAFLSPTKLAIIVQIHTKMAQTTIFLKLPNITLVVVILMGC